MRLHKSHYIISIAVSILYSSITFAYNPPIPGRTLGITYAVSKQELSVYLDQNSILKNIPKLQKNGLVDANLSKTQVSFYDTQLPAMVSIPYVSQIIYNLYKSKKINDQLHVSTYLFTTNLYGNKTNMFCYSFNFNRQLFQKINWKNFHSSNIVKIVPDFKTSKECSVVVETSPLDI